MVDPAGEQSLGRLPIDLPDGMRQLAGSYDLGTRSEQSADQERYLQFSKWLSRSENLVYAFLFAEVLQRRKCL